MENYDRMIVNNLVCETLNPENIIAKLYNYKMNETDKNELIQTINNEMNKKNDYHKIIYIMDSVNKKDYKSNKEVAKYL
jgi:hypothetical protein